MDRGRVPLVLPRTWRCLAGRRPRCTGGGENRTWAEDAPQRKGDGAARRAVASDARRGGTSLVVLLPGDQEARGRDRGNRQGERCFKQCCCCKTVIGKSKDRSGKTTEVEQMKSTDFIVARSDLRDCKFIETPLPDA